jgi:DNA-directed RNA polymerase subunit RPC12/RpoP
MSGERRSSDNTEVTLLSPETLMKNSNLVMSRSSDWPGWYKNVYQARTIHYRCPRDFSKMVIPKNMNWSTFKNQMEEELLQCPRCGHKLGYWYIQYLKGVIEKQRQQIFDSGRFGSKPTLKLANAVNEFEKQMKELCGIPKIKSEE